MTPSIIAIINKLHESMAIPHIPLLPNSKILSFYPRKSGRTYGQLWEICCSKRERYERKFVSGLKRSFCLWCLETCLQNQVGAAVCTVRWLYFRSQWTSVAGSLSVARREMNAQEKCSFLPCECSCPEASHRRNKIPFPDISPIQRCQREVGKEALSPWSCLSPSGRLQLFAGDEKKVWFSHLMKSLKWGFQLTSGHERETLGRLFSPLLTGWSGQRVFLSSSPVKGALADGSVPFIPAGEAGGGSPLQVPETPDSGLLPFSASAL